jgi:hypothetical protein
MAGQLMCVDVLSRRMVLAEGKKAVRWGNFILLLATSL